MTSCCSATNVRYKEIFVTKGQKKLSKQGTEIIGLIQICLADEPRAEVLQRLLTELKAVAETLGDNEKCPAFHNGLRGFIYVWGDLWMPQEESISPLVGSLFDLHGFPERKSSPM